ncbi:unnamed protein product, partial [Ectocarpus sp. 8 AP-2014]
MHEGTPTGCFLHAPVQNFDECDSCVTRALQSAHAHEITVLVCMTLVNPQRAGTKKLCATRVPPPPPSPLHHRAYHPSTSHSQPAYLVHHRLSAAARPALTLSLNLWLSLRTNP